MSKYLTTLAKRALRRMSGEQPPRDEKHGLVAYDSSDEETELASDEEDRSSNADTELASDNEEEAHPNVDADAADEEDDRQSNAGDEPAVDEDEDNGPPPVNQMFYDPGDGDEDDEAGRDYGPHYRDHPDYQSFPATGPEPEDEGDDDGESFATTFFGAPPSPERAEDDGPSAADYDHNVDDEVGPEYVEDSGSGSSTAGGFVLDDNDNQLEYVMDGQVYHVEHSDSSSESDGTSDNDASSDDDEGSRSPARSRSPDIYDVPQTASQDIDANDAFVKKLSTLGLSDAEILDAMLGVNHRAVSTHRNPTPPPSPGTLKRQQLAAAQPAPPPAAVVIRPEVAQRLAQIRSGGGRLTRTMNGDAWVPTGTGQYMSSRTGLVTGQAFAQDVVKLRQRNNMVHLAEGIETGRVVVVVRDDDSETPQSSSPSSRNSLSSSDSRDVDAVDQSLAADESAGDSSTSDAEVTSSQRQQVLAAPVNAPTSPTRKRSREESSDSEAETELNTDTDDEASPEKRRRILSEEQQGSSAVLRLRPRAPSSTRSIAGSPTAATRTTSQLDTAAAAAPVPDNEGAAVVEPTTRAADGSDEIPVASTSEAPAAEPAQEAAAPTAGPSRQPRGRGRRASPSPAVPVRRSRRIPIVAEAARIRAAEEARRATEAAPAPRRRGKGRGKAKGKGKGGA